MNIDFRESTMLQVLIKRRYGKSTPPPTVMCLCVCLIECVRACVCACVRACVRASVRSCVRAALIFLEISMPTQF